MVDVKGSVVADGVGPQRETVGNSRAHRETRRHRQPAEDSAGPLAPLKLHLALLLIHGDFEMAHEGHPQQPHGQVPVDIDRDPDISRLSRADADRLQGGYGRHDQATNRPEALPGQAFKPGDPQGLGGLSGQYRICRARVDHERCRYELVQNGLDDNWPRASGRGDRECTGNELRLKSARDDGFQVQGILRPW
jgi:hypothetical protein